jgi:hypothetical protein
LYSLWAHFFVYSRSLRGQILLYFFFEIVNHFYYFLKIHYLIALLLCKCLDS